jgi:hypothetical protein
MTSRVIVTIDTTIATETEKFTIGLLTTAPRTCFQGRPLGRGGGADRDRCGGWDDRRDDRRDEVGGVGRGSTEPSGGGSAGDRGTFMHHSSNGQITYPGLVHVV